ncbi:MAG: HD-GYP domain-containing protein [Firmicutes bacterium HGW-Firmicutes-8]|nr:MAG: HD-GYP domain-containing protein [Firmicutes bacterium HGW-Firmicutes-8]
MRMVRIDNIGKGCRLARPVVNGDQTLMLSKGVVLNSYYLRRLKNIGYTYLYIEDESVDESKTKDIVSRKTRTQALKCLREIAESIKHGETFEVDSTKFAVSNILNEVIRNKDMVLHLANIDSHDEYTFNHSVNVTVISIIIGVALNYDLNKLFELGVSIFLHDIGKVLVPLNILNKPLKLADEEWGIISKHTWHGFYVLSNSPEVSFDAANTALQHHERYDGSGYQQGLRGEGISEFARICAIADVYDALSSKRPYRDRLPVHKVWEYLLKNKSKHFDPYILERFIKNIKIYPEGSIVTLNNGSAGYVIKQNPMNPIRPVVKVHWHNDIELPVPMVVNLIEEPSLLIVEVAI